MSADTDEVRRWIGDAPADDEIDAWIEVHGSSWAAAQWYLERLRASLLGKPPTASVEGYSYSWGSNLDGIEALIAELKALQSDDGGVIELHRPDFTRPGGDYWADVI